MPHRYLRATEPIVAHGLREMSVEGASLQHVLRQIALMAALVGSGETPTQAIRQVEAVEERLLAPHPGEAVEPYHIGGYGKGAGAIPYGKGAGALPYGKGAGAIPYGKGAGAIPYGKGAGALPYGKGAGAIPYGKGAGAIPYGKDVSAIPYGKGVSPTPYGKGLGVSPYTVSPFASGIQQW